MSDPASPPSRLGSPPPAGGFWATVAAVVGCFSMFAIILAIAYWPEPIVQADPEDGPPVTDAGRLNLYRQTQAAALEKAGIYEWVDREKKVVRLPTARAMEVVVEELGRPTPGT